MNTIRVMAWPERAYLTAHAAKTTPGKIPSVSKLRAFSLLQQINTIQTCEHPIPANSPHAIT
jgi:hypothetical protein